MAQIIRLKRSNNSGDRPTTSSLQTGEIAINVYDGRAFTRKSGSVDEIKTINSKTIRYAAKTLPSVSLYLPNLLQFSKN
jgi:hypothetical protein